MDARHATRSRSRFGALGARGYPVLPYLQLARVPGAVTAAGNALAGAWVATGGAVTAPVAAGAGATVLLYAGGVTFNDYFDREADYRERAVRPIPSGRVSPRSARFFASGLTVLGLALAAFVSVPALAIALGIVAFTFTYNSVGKHSEVAGPLNMGVLRGLAFTLGVAVVPGALTTFTPLALAYVLFIVGVTVASEGEVAGASRARLSVAAGFAAAGVALAAVFVVPAALVGHAAPFLIAFAAVPAAAFLRAFAAPTPERVRGIVLAGVLSVAFLDATFAAAAAGWAFGLALAAVAPVAWTLSRAVPVT